MSELEGDQRGLGLKLEAWSLMPRCARLGAQLGCPAGRGSCVFGPPQPFSLWDLTNHLLIHVLTQQMFTELLLCGPGCHGGGQAALMVLMI